MSLSVSRIQNEPIPVPASNLAFKGNKIAAGKAFDKIVNKLYSAATIAGVLCMIFLPIMGWVTGCNQIVKDKNTNKTELPANTQDTTNVHFDVDV